MNRRTASRVIGGVTLGWVACFSYLVLSPRIPDVPGFADDDAVLGAGHLVASLILSALVYLWLVTASPQISRQRTAALAFGAASAFGLVVELVQFPIPEREPQLADAALDVTGAAIGVAALAMVSQPALRRPQVPAIVGTLGTILVASTAGAIVMGSTATRAEERCPGTVSDEPLPSVRPAVGSDDVQRVDAGLLALFDFAERPSDESSGRFDLVARGAVEHIEPSGVRILDDRGVMSSPGPARRIADRITDEFTLEAWARPDRLTQHGPARIVSNSDGQALSEVNFHVGQDRHCLSLRVDTGGREAEWLLLEDVFDHPQPVWHLVATYERGTVQIFVDGERELEASLPDADLSGWSPEYPLLVGNEVTRNRPFLGDVYLVALYDRALTAREVAQNHDAGF